MKKSKPLAKVAKKAPPAPPPPPPPPPPPRKPAEFAPEETIDLHAPRLPHRVDPPGIPYKLDLPARPARATHIRWQSADGTTTVEVPAGHYGDFSSHKTGRVTWGRIHDPRGDWEEISEDEGRAAAVTQHEVATNHRPPPPPPTAGKSLQNVPAWLKPKAPPAASRIPKAPGIGPKKEGVCAFIDALIMEGGRTADEVLALVMAKFPGRDPKATLSTVKTRPSHIKAKGLVPPAFAK